MWHNPTVFVIDSELATRHLIKDLIRGTDLQCVVYEVGREFFAAYDAARPGCVVLELSMPDMSGLQIQRRLASLQATLPLIFLTARADFSMAVEVMRGGAMNVLQKPPRPLELWNAVQEGITLDRQRRKLLEQQTTMRDRIAALTWKERQLLGLLAEGKASTDMSIDLGITVRAVQLRRQQLLKKLRIHSSAELVRFAIAAMEAFGSFFVRSDSSYPFDQPEYALAGDDARQRLTSASSVAWASGLRGWGQLNS